jgi:hypothetical protein
MRISPALRACTLILSPLLALGQQVSAPVPQPAAIVGTVTDIQNAAIANAAVTLDGAESSEHAVTASNGQGFFAFNDLTPGETYHINVAAPGFATWNSPSVTLTPGQQFNLAPIKLTISVVQTTVTALTPEEAATQEVKIAEKQRVLGVFPNFYVVYTPNPAPLTTKLKYQLALKTLYDPVNILGIAFFAGIDQIGDDPDYQEGTKGYFQRFGAGYADNLTDVMFGGAIFPSLFHQDPRYFYQGTGSVGSRFRHAVASPFVCKGDNGDNQFNISSIAGDMVSGAMSNIYYPESNRGPALVFEGTALATGGRIVDALAQEFVFRHFTPSAKKQKQN